MDNFDRDFQQKYGHQYDDLNLNPESKSVVIAILVAAIAAIVGSIPGVMLGTFIGNFGFISTITGLITGAGAFFAYLFASKTLGRDELAAIDYLICIAVILIAIYISARMVIVNAMYDSLISQTKKLTTNEYGFSSAEAKSLVCEFYGISTVTKGECSSHLSDLLEKLELKGDYIGYMFKNIAFAALGIFAPLAKNIKTN